MNIVRYTHTDAQQVCDTVQRQLIRTAHLMTVIVDVGGGPAAQPDPYHSHLHEQTTYIAAGEILFLIEGEDPVRLGPGDLVAIASGQRHAIQLLTPTARLIDSFTPVREDFLPDTPH